MKEYTVPQVIGDECGAIVSMNLIPTDMLCIRKQFVKTDHHVSEIVIERIFL
jgi:hypothetical protein